jgi:hypothetical protein
MKNYLKHALAVALLTVFVLLALGSDGTTPPPASGGGGGGGGGQQQQQRINVTFENWSNQVVTVRIEGLSPFTVPAFASHTGRPGRVTGLSMVRGRNITHSPSSVQRSISSDGTLVTFR